MPQHSNCYQFSSVAQSCPTLCDPMNCSTPGLPVHHQLPEFTQTHVHRVSDTIQPSHPLSSPSPPVPTPSQHQSIFQWVNSSHEVAKVLEFQLQHQSFSEDPGLISFRMDCIIPSKEIPDQKGFPIMTFDALICSGIVMASKFVSLSSNSEIQIYIKPFG